MARHIEYMAIIDGAESEWSYTKDQNDVISIKQTTHYYSGYSMAIPEICVTLDSGDQLTIPRALCFLRWSKDDEK